MHDLVAFAPKSHQRKQTLRGDRTLEIANRQPVEAAQISIHRVQARDASAGEMHEQRIGRESLEAERPLLSNGERVHQKPKLTVKRIDDLLAVLEPTELLAQIAVEVRGEGERLLVVPRWFPPAPSLRSRLRNDGKRILNIVRFSVLWADPSTPLPRLPVDNGVKGFGAEENTNELVPSRGRKAGALEHASAVAELERDDKRRELDHESRSRESATGAGGEDRLFPVALALGPNTGSCRHMGREEWSVRAESPGVPLNIVKELMGHQSIEMTMRYAHFAPAARDAAIVCLEPLRIGMAAGGQPVGNGLPNALTENKIVSALPVLH